MRREITLTYDDAHDPVPFTFDQLVVVLARELEYRKNLERKVKELEGRERLRFERENPELARRERLAELDGEIRLLHEQG